MTGRTSRIQKYMLCFQKMCIFWENHDFIEKKGKKVDFFSCDFKIFDSTIGCATKFHANEIQFFFLSIFVRSKVIALFCEKFAIVEHTICDCN